MGTQITGDAVLLTGQEQPGQKPSASRLMNTNIVCAIPAQEPSSENCALPPDTAFPCLQCGQGATSVGGVPSSAPCPCGECDALRWMLSALYMKSILEQQGGNAGPQFIHQVISSS